MCPIDCLSFQRVFEISQYVTPLHGKEAETVQSLTSGSEFRKTNNRRELCDCHKLGKRRIFKMSRLQASLAGINSRQEQLREFIPSPSPHSYPMGTGGSFPEGKAAGA